MPLKKPRKISQLKKKVKELKKAGKESKTARRKEIFKKWKSRILRNENIDSIDKIHLMDIDGKEKVFRGIAIMELGFSKNKKFVPALVHALRTEPEWKNRVRAVNALSKIEDKRVKPALVKASKTDFDLRVKGFAMKKLAELKEKKG